MTRFFRHSYRKRLPRRTLLLATALLLVFATLAAPGGAAPADEPVSERAADQETKATFEDSVERPVARQRFSAEDKFVPGELLVRFRSAAPPSTRAAVRSRHGLTKVRDLPLEGLELVRFAGRASAQQRAAQVANENSVRYAEPNFIQRKAAPNDPLYPDQWGLDNTGQTGGTADADIDFPEALDLASDSGDMVVAVIDTGVDIDHPDLAANIWTNSNETANGVDSDGNGYADDIHGWDFFHDDSSVFDQADGDNHGTHVAGTVSAVTDNNQGVAGVSQAKVMVLKFLGPSGGTLSDAILAIDYALSSGAHLTNNSWGCLNCPSNSLKDKIDEAAASGQLFVAAAGNQSNDNDGGDKYYPASYDSSNIVSVAATNHNDQLASFSNYGASTVHMGAPGVQILSTVPTASPDGTKAVLTSPGSDLSIPYRSAFHTFGLEGVETQKQRNSLMEALTNWIGLRTSSPILIVDDDNGASFETVYNSTISGLGYTNLTIHTVGPCADGPQASELAGYAAVIWLTADQFDCTLTPADQSRLSTYLDAGGKLALFGVDIGYDITDDGATVNAFMRDMLRANYLADFDFNLTLEGREGTRYASVGTLDLKPGSSGDGQDYSSVISPRPGGVATIDIVAPGYESYNGTSMAAPHVAGAAAQVIAAQPGISLADLKARLVNTGDQIPSLATKTISGRRLNLYNALAPAEPAAAVGSADDSQDDGTTETAASEQSELPFFRSAERARDLANQLLSDPERWVPRD